MGTYINSGYWAFAEINDEDYVDKTGLIALVNRTIGTRSKLTCVSRPRRFGKSFAAKMLTAYYDCSCDSHKLFDDKDIAKTEDYQKLAGLMPISTGAQCEAMTASNLAWIIR